MKAFCLIFFCFALSFNVRAGRLVTTNPVGMYDSLNGQETASASLEIAKKATDTSQSIAIDQYASAGIIDETPSFSSLVTYFLEPELAGALLLVILFGMSGMKHAD